MVRYTPYIVSNLQQQINRMLDQFDQEAAGSTGLGGGMFSPAMDVKENADAYVVHLEVPGIKQENLDLTMQDNILTIRGQKEQRQASVEAQFRRVERSYGSFARSLTLPRKVDSNAISANLQDGVLEIVLPKAREARPRQISVGVTTDSPALSAPSQTSEAQASAANDVESTTANSA